MLFDGVLAYRPNQTDFITPPKLYILKPSSAVVTGLSFYKNHVRPRFQSH